MIIITKFIFLIFLIFQILPFNRVHGKYLEKLYTNLSIELSDFVSQNSKPIDLNQILTNRVVYFGEYHTETIPKKFLIVNMNEFANKGYTHLALEMFAQESQTLLNRFEKGLATDREIMRYLDSNWGYKTNHLTLNLMKAAIKFNIKLLAIDHRIKGEGINVEKRDVAMASTIAEIINKDPSNKVIVLIGLAHISASSTDMLTQYQPQILDEMFGIKSSTYLILPKYEFTTVTCPNINSPRNNCITNHYEEHNLLRETVYTIIPNHEGLFIQTTIQLSGYDGILLIDNYHENINSKRVKFHQLNNLTN